MWFEMNRSTSFHSALWTDSIHVLYTLKYMAYNMYKNKRNRETFSHDGMILILNAEPGLVLS